MSNDDFDGFIKSVLEDLRALHKGDKERRLIISRIDNPPDDPGEDDTVTASVFVSGDLPFISRTFVSLFKTIMSNKQIGKDQLKVWLKVTLGEIVANLDRPEIVRDVLVSLANDEVVQHVLGDIDKHGHVSADIDPMDLN